MKDKQKRRASVPDPTMGPFGFTIAIIKTALSGIVALFKHPKMLLLTVFIAVLQTALAYLKLLLPSSEWVKYASLITFAQGGMYAGLLGAVGGVIGKGFYTWFINNLVFSMFKAKGVKPAKLKEPKTKGALGLALLGLGLALIVYNFLSGNASLENSVIGVTAMFASYQTLKKKNGFLVGFICSFTKGRMTRTAASIVIKGMMVGFFLGVLSSLKFSGVWCYLAGATFLILALMFLMMRRRMVVAVAALVVMMGSILPVLGLLQVTDKWVSVQEAYGIKGDTLTSYIELTNAVSAAPPANMELTLIAMGARNFDESVRIEEQKVIVENGESGSFRVEAQFEDFSFSSLVSLHLEADGYYASASTAYSANNSWTQDEVEEGNYQADTLSYFSFRHLGAASYLYDAYLEPGKFYMEISIPFGYGDMLGQGQVSSATQILARVDLVKRDGGISESDAPTGYWELKESLMYVITSEGNSISNTEKINGQFIGDDPSDKGTITISGSVIDYVVRRDMAEVYTEHTYRTVFGSAPVLLKSFEVVEISFEQTHAFYDSRTDQTTSNPNPFAVVGFLPNRRPDSFSTKLSVGDVMAYPFGADLGQTWFTRQDSVFVGNVPSGKVAGEIMTLEMAMGFHEPFDTSTARIWDIPVLAYVYEWKGSALPPRDDEEEEDDYSWGQEDFDEHANEEETAAISAAAALAGLLGAAAAAAGLAGGFGGSESIKKDDEGDYIVHDPITGEERVYVRNKETGRYSNPLTGAEYTEDELYNQVASRSENAAVLGQDFEQSERAKSEQRLANQNLSRAEHDFKQEERMHKLQRDLEKQGQDGDEIAGAMAAKLDRMNTQKRQSGSNDPKDIDQFQRTYGLWTKGSLAGKEGLPPAESEWTIFKAGLANTGEEIVRGESNKAIALRIAVSLLTGSFVERAAMSAAAAATVEAGLELAQAGYGMKDYVDKGGNDWKEGAKLAITKTLVGEAIGRTFGLGLGALGKVVSKTGQFISKSQTGKIIVDAISNYGEKAGKVLNANLGDVPKVIKNLGKEASESALATKMANAGVAKLKNALGESAEQTGRVERLGKRVGDTADVAKAQKSATDLNVKTEAKQAVENAKLPPKETASYKRVSKEVDDTLKKAEERAADKIEKFRNDVKVDPKLAKRNEAHLKGKEEGLEAVKKLDEARQKLANNPDSPELKQELEQAVKDVQINKHAQKVMNEKDLTGNATRQDFNNVKVKKDAVITMNTNERIANEYGLDPKRVRNVQATNNMNTEAVGDIKGVAGESILGKQGNAKSRQLTEKDLDLAKLENKGGDKISIDLDQTYRVEIKMKDGSIEYRDISARKIKQIQNEEVYKEWNKGELPMKNGEVDHEAVKAFAEEMDYTVLDARSPDAYGTVGDLQQALKNDGSIRHYGDPEAVSRTIQYKSDEWIHTKADVKLKANEIVSAEGDIAEGIRQGTKQFDSQLVYQVKAINAKEGATKLVIPPKLAEGMSVLKQIGHGKGKLSPAEAEAVLKRMGTNTDEILKMNSEQTEFINRVIARRFKDE